MKSRHEEFGHPEPVVTCPQCIAIHSKPDRQEVIRWLAQDAEDLGIYTPTTVVHWDDRPADGDYVYIGRKGGGEWGNPFISGVDGTRDEVIETYRRWFGQMVGLRWFREKVWALRGRVLVCHCKPLACHGDVIAEYLNNL